MLLNEADVLGVVVVEEEFPEMDVTFVQVGDSLSEVEVLEEHEPTHVSVKLALALGQSFFVTRIVVLKVEQTISLTHLSVLQHMVDLLLEADLVEQLEVSL